MPGDIRQVLSAMTSRENSSGNTGNTYTVNMAKFTYTVSNHGLQPHRGALVDRGANGGVAGEDIRIVDQQTPLKTVNIQGIDNHQINDVRVGTVAAVVPSQRGEVIAIMHNYALNLRGRTIHSSLQLEDYYNVVHDRSTKVSEGKQHIKTLDGYIHPLDFKNGLAYIPMRPYTDKEWELLPHVVWTAPHDWDPSKYDNNLSDKDQWYESLNDLPNELPHPEFNEIGDYRENIETAIHEATIAKPGPDPILDTWTDLQALLNDEDKPVNQATQPPDSSCVMASNNEIKKKPPDYESMKPLFGWLPVDIITKTFNNTTQYARIPQSTVLKKHYKSPNPALNVHRRNEDVATDTVFSNTPAIDNGSTAAQIFVGCQSMVTDIYGVKTDKQFVKALEDNIRDRGAMKRVISDNARAETGVKVLDILRSLYIGWWQSEPHQQQQNPAERRYQTLKSMTNSIMDYTGSPPFTWLLALTYASFILNHTFCSSINKVPLTALTGSTTDISPLLRFTFWEPIYYKIDDSDFPSESRERKGRFVGIAEHVGHAMTFKIYCEDTKRIIYRSNVRTATDPRSRNWRQEIIMSSEDVPMIVKSKVDDAINDGAIQKGNMPVIPMEEEPTHFWDEIIGRTFLMKPEADGQKFRARIVKAINDHDKDTEGDLTRTKFLLSINNDTVEKVMAYGEIMDQLANQIEEDEGGDIILWKFKNIKSHEGPLDRKHPNWKGSSYNVLLEWETGEITSEPLDIIAKDAPLSCARYAKENGLLDTVGWKRFRKMAKRDQKMLRMINQAKLSSYRSSPKYMYGFEVPKNYNHAMEIDEKNGNTKWGDAISLEMKQLMDYQTFKDYGHKVPLGHKKIRTHLVFAVKHDGRHKARMVADGHLTDAPLESVYSGVVSLRGFRLVTFVAEYNKIRLWATDIGNAYLEAKTAEKVYIIAGPEFGELKGHTLVIVRALYGLRSSGIRWHEKFSRCMKEMGFFPCKAEPDIWLRKNGTMYEYVAVYVDDLAIAVKEPEKFIKTLQDKYKFQLKGTGEITFHLGCDFFRDSTGTLCYAPRKYIKKILDGYEQMFNEKPSQKCHSPIEKGDHPELDTSDFLLADDISKYLSMVGALQWIISIGRFDITTAVMTLGSFRVAPRKGHMDRLKRIYGYLAKFPSATIRIRTDLPDYSNLPDLKYDWEHSVYGNVKEDIPLDIPTPLGKPVILTSYVDANLRHDMVTGRSVTGILHLINKTPFDWYSKKQATVETATYGSEFIAARTCVEQVIDIRQTLRYLGIPILGKTYMFGDNKSVVDSSTIPHHKLHKRHNQLSFHRVREAIASGMITFIHIDGVTNPADILSKHWGHDQVWKVLQPLLFWEGNTARLIKKDTQDEMDTQEE